MILVSAKKKTLAVVLAAVLVIAAGVTAVILPSALTPAAASNGMTIVIDPGHGGRDGGVVGRTTGVKESDVNLGVSKSLRHFLREAGYNVVMTRETDEDLSSGEGSFKKSDMLARKRIIENAKADLVVSVHQNFYPRKDIKGAQVFYAPNSETGADYASRIQSVLNDSLGSDRVAKSGDYYIIQCSDVPSVLVECGFLSNPEEESLLVTAEYQQRVAYALSAAIRAILEPNAFAPDYEVGHRA